MLQKIKTFVIIGVCSVYIVNNTTAQDKKVFDNVGVYFYPMVDINDYKFYFDGWALGLRTSVNLNDRILLDFGLAYGQSSYNSLLERSKLYDFLGPTAPATNISSQLTRSDCRFLYIISNIDKTANVYILGGAIFTVHISETYLLLENSILVQNDKINLHNILLQTGLGYSYTITSNWAINTEISVGLPIWRNHIKIQGTILPLIHNKHDYNICSGINLGLIYKW
jgi:hypothetical protein